MTTTNQCQQHRENCQKQFHKYANILIGVLVVVLGGLFTITVSNLCVASNTQGQVEIIKSYLEPPRIRQRPDLPSKAGNELAAKPTNERKKP